MSEGEELIRDVWRRWNAGERELDPEVFDPDFEVHSALAGGVFSGDDGIRRWAAEIDDQFEAWKLEIDEIRDLGAESCIAHGRIRARGRQSGVDLDQPASWFVEVRDGRLRRIQNFIGPDARRAAEELV